MVHPPMLPALVIPPYVIDIDSAVVPAEPVLVRYRNDPTGTVVVQVPTTTALPETAICESPTLVTPTLAVLDADPKTPNTKPAIATAAMRVTAMMRTVAMIGEIAVLLPYRIFIEGKVF